SKSFVPPAKNLQLNTQLEVSGTPLHGTAIIAPGTTNTILYTPQADFIGTDSFYIGLSSGPCGVYMIPVTITVENELTDLNLDGNITPMDRDSDGDGFPDAIEELLGTSSADYNETPTGFTDAGFNTFPLGSKALKLKPNKKTQLEKVKLKGMLPVAPP